MIKRIQLIPLTIIKIVFLFILNAIWAGRLLNLSQVVWNVSLKDVCTKFKISYLFTIICKQGIKVEKVLTFLMLYYITHCSIDLWLGLIITIIQTKLTLQISLHINLIVQYTRLVHDRCQELSLLKLCSAPSKQVVQVVIHYLVFTVFEVNQTYFFKELLH